ncbi:Ankyrin repeat-containing domain [Trinorchestia longiramus]|nr:Ankyrin repeat-containing domain [Trinorchestia longiramus]
MATIAGSPPRWTLSSQLLLAIRTQDVTRASQLLSSGVDVDTKFAINAKRRPALCLSVENNDLAMVQLLLRLGASINQADSTGECPLHIACSRGYCSLADVLLHQARPNVNARTLQGTTALHAAAAQGSLELIEKLLSHGADFNVQDKNGVSTLHLACSGGHSEICSTLLDAGAHAAILDYVNNTPLHYAVSTFGVDVDNIKKLITKCPQALCITNKSGETPLIIAIRSLRHDIKELLESILKLALKTMPKICHSVILGHRTVIGHTPLHLAVLEKQISCVRILLAAGAEVDSRDHLGHTPLALASRDGNAELVSLLLSAGASTRTLVSRNVINDDVKDPMLAQMLVDASKQPVKLSSACRETLCRTFGLADELSSCLPHNWREFLKFERLEL